MTAAKGNPMVNTAQVPVTVIQKAVSMEIAFPEEIPANEYYHLVHRRDSVSFETAHTGQRQVENVTYESSNPEIVAYVTERGEIRPIRAEPRDHRLLDRTLHRGGAGGNLGEFWLNVCRRTITTAWPATKSSGTRKAA